MKGLNNTTVKDMLILLQSMNPDALVCYMFQEKEEDKPTFFTFEACTEMKDTTYIDGAGYEKKGDVVAIF